MALSQKKLLISLMVLTIFMMVFVGLGTIVFGAVISANEQFQGFGISKSALGLNIALGLLFIGFSLFGVFGVLRKSKSCIAMNGYLVFIGFVIYVYFTVRLANYTKDIRSEIDDAKNQSQNQCRFQLNNSKYNLEFLHKYQETSLSAQLFCQTNCACKGYSGLTQVASGVSAVSGSVTKLSDCPAYTPTDKQMKMNKLIGKLQADKGCSGRLFFVSVLQNISQPNGNSCLNQIPDFVDGIFLPGIVLCAIFSVFMFASLILSFMTCTKIQVPEKENDKGDKIADEKGKDYVDNP